MALVQRLPLAIKPIESACPTPMRVSDTSPAPSLQAPHSSCAGNHLSTDKVPVAPRELAAEH
jgi:hypothetical protein